MLSHGVRTGVIQFNPVIVSENAGFGVTARDRVWEPEEIEAFLTHAPAQLHIAASLLFYTTQRLSDVLTMDWSKVSERDGRFFVRLRQRKTGKLIDVPAHRDLEAVLRPKMQEQGLLVTSPCTDKVWQKRNFARAWDEVMKKAGEPIRKFV